MATRMIAKRAGTFSNHPYWTQSQAKAQRAPGEPGVGMSPPGVGGPSGSNFMVARAQLISPRQLVVTGTHVGATQFILMDEQDRATVYDIVVQVNIAQLKALLADAAP